ncbi:glycosyltransferase family 2 protein [Streptococcus sp. E17BB]|uniref:glycosyltransferase family 2 protein n=1 Tax=Streptococcus sp. E17BB TaxID=3278714 RepID=UPI00359EA88F
MVKVSVICTNYNKGNWIGEALESILKQETSFAYEIIVVDDASTDHSPQLIRDYQAKFPDKIRAFFNPTNQGIAKTWKLICQEAHGDYIARCDGDDFWTDSHKLQKQVNLLTNHPTARWSNTDFDLVDSQGQVFQEKALQNGIIPFMDSYEKMLALKGMTMSSTWLVARDLMLEVNAELPDDATDDTFNLQLELFQRTELAFLPESTTVYRMVSESDSRTTNKSKLLERLAGILDTQYAYLSKYPQINLLEIARLQAEHGMKQEDRIAQLVTEIKALQERVHDLEIERELLTEKTDNWQEAFTQLDCDYQDLFKDYHAVIGSRRWRIPTKLINFFRRNK